MGGFNKFLLFYWADGLHGANSPNFIRNAEINPIKSTKHLLPCPRIVVVFYNNWVGLAAGFGAASLDYAFYQWSKYSCRLQTTDHTPEPDLAPAICFSTFPWPNGRCIKAYCDKEMDNLDFPSHGQKYLWHRCGRICKPVFSKTKPKDEKYLAELLKRCNDNGVKNYLIMCDGEGDHWVPRMTT